jgi:hypothetical protein
MLTIRYLVILHMPKMVLLPLVVVVRSSMQIGVPAVDLFWQSWVALASSPYVYSHPWGEHSVCKPTVLEGVIGSL